MSSIFGSKSPTQTRVKAVMFALFITLPAIAEDQLDMELLMFLAEFTDEKGDWDAPEVEQPTKTTTETGAAE